MNVYHYLLDEWLQLAVDIVQDDHAVVRGGQVGGDGGGRRGLLAGAGLERDGDRLTVCQRLEAGDVLGELLVDGGLRARDRAHLQPDGLWHPLGLVGQGDGVAVASPLLPRHLPHVNLDVEPLVNLRDGFLHCLLLNESTRQLDVVIGNGGVEVGGHVRDLGASGHAGGRGDRGEAALELLLHDAGQRVDITEGEVANGAVLKAEKENV